MTSGETWWPMVIVRVIGFVITVGLHFLLWRAGARTNVAQAR